VFAGDGQDARFTQGSGLRKLGRVPKARTGTRTRFWPDEQIFVQGADFAFDSLVQRARQTAYLVPGLVITVTDERAEESPEGPKTVEFAFDGGISEFCAHLSCSAPVTDVVRLKGKGQFTETVPVLDDQGHLTPTDVERELEVDVALRWDTGYDTITRSFVNVIATPKGGTHVTGFDRALVKTLN
jgi:DNA gyrase subunit B